MVGTQRSRALDCVCVRFHRPRAGTLKPKKIGPFFVSDLSCLSLPQDGNRLENFLKVPSGGPSVGLTNTRLPIYKLDEPFTDNSNQACSNSACACARSVDLEQLDPL